MNNLVTVVFDGAEGSYGWQGDIRVIFSDGCSADDQIKRMAEEDDDLKNCVVVSDDKDIYLYARSMGARVMSVTAFTSAGKSGGPRTKVPTGKNISLGSQEKINKELLGIWLKEKK